MSLEPSSSSQGWELQQNSSETKTGSEWETHTVITSSCIHLSSWRDVGGDWHSFTALEKPDAISTQRSEFWAPCRVSTRPLPLQRRGSGSPGSWGHRASLPSSLGHRGAGPNLSEVGGATWEDFLSSSAQRPPPPTPNLHRNSSGVLSPRPALGVAEGQGPARHLQSPSSAPQGSKSCHLRKEGAALFPGGPFFGWGFPSGF